MRNPVGTHVLVGKNLVAGALASADELGCEAVQVFVGNPRGWARSPGDPAVDAAFREATAAGGTRVVIHTPYLVNLGSPTPATYESSVALVAHNLRRAVEIGAEGVVVHTGSYVDAGGPDSAVALHAAAMRRVREGLLPVLEALGDDEAAPWLLLEPTAGQGRSLCAGVDDLEAYLDEPGGATAVVDRIVEIGGPGRLRLVHANDSKDPRGSFRDRHEKLGEGRIGTAMLAELLAHPATEGVPFIAETPGSRTPGSSCLALLKQLREQDGPQR